MTILSDRDIRSRLYEPALIAGGLGIGCEPPPDNIQIQPSSLDLRLGTSFRWFDRPLGKIEFVEPIDPEKAIDPKWMRKAEISSDGFFDILPGQFVLATTAERVRVPCDLVARVEGRSSLGRIGLIVHATAGYIDPGFEGQITLEMVNLVPRPIRLRAGMRICQLAFTPVSSLPERPYGHPELKSKYQGQMGATESRLHADAERQKESGA